MNPKDDKTSTPIKRHETIVQCSREHHYGLLLVWKIKQGIQKNIDPERISSYVLYFFENDFREHFRNEEDNLFSKLTDDNSLKIQALQEHQQIYSLIETIRNEKNSYPLLVQFSALLEKHIRFEERILFSHIQEVVPENDLLNIPAHHHTDSNRVDDLWTDHFWEKDN